MTEAQHRRRALVRQGLHEAAINAKRFGDSAQDFEMRALSDADVLAAYGGDARLLERELHRVRSALLTKRRTRGITHAEQLRLVRYEALIDDLERRERELIEAGAAHRS